jgi:hypothetical protein
LGKWLPSLSEPISFHTGLLHQFSQKLIVYSGVNAGEGSKSCITDHSARISGDNTAGLEGIKARKDYMGSFRAESL